MSATHTHEYACLTCHQDLLVPDDMVHTCIICSRRFVGRSNAKTCSDRCRQRLHRKEPTVVTVTEASDG